MMSIFKKIIALLFLNIFIISAQTEVFIGKARIIIGSDMTELQAIELAKMQTEKEAAQKAGIYIESHSKVKNNLLIEDVITTFSADILKMQDFTYNKILEGNALILEAIGKYIIDEKGFLERIKAISNEKILREKLRIANEKHQTLLALIMKSINFDNRRKLIEEFKENQIQSRELYLGKKITIVNQRIENLKEELTSKLKQFELNMLENSTYDITKEDIQLNNVWVYINYKREYDLKIAKGINEIFNFACQKGILSKDPCFFSGISNTPNLKLNCYNEDGQKIYSKKIYIFSAGIGKTKLDNGEIKACLYICNGPENKLGESFPIKTDKCNIKIIFDYYRMTGTLVVQIPKDEKITLIRLEH